LIECGIIYSKIFLLEFGVERKEVVFGADVFGWVGSEVFSGQLVISY